MRNIFLASLIALSLAIPGPAHAGDVLFQVETIAGLMEGKYDGTVTVDKLLTNGGGFGIGTFDRLDGEMVVLDGICYQVRVDGTVNTMDRTATTPFAEVTRFEPEISGTNDGPLNMDGLMAYIDGLAPDMNIPYAVKVSGSFGYVKTRSVPPQEKPYPRLVDAVKGQHTFEMTDVEGTLVGFRLPASMEEVSVPGYHLHFITDDTRAGGHVLGLTTGAVTVELDEMKVYTIVPVGVYPRTGDTRGGNEDELKTIEGGR